MPSCPVSIYTIATEYLLSFFFWFVIFEMVLSFFSNHVVQTGPNTPRLAHPPWALPGPLPLTDEREERVGGMGVSPLFLDGVQRPEEHQGQISCFPGWAE